MNERKVELNVTSLSLELIHLIVSIMLVILFSHSHYIVMKKLELALIFFWKLIVKTFSSIMIGNIQFY